MKTWVKLYTESNRDPKIGTLSWAQRGIWSALLCLAGELDVRDEHGNETGALDTLENVAWHIRCDVAELAEAVEAFAERGMVDERDGILFVTNYGKRQNRAPSASRGSVAERVKRYRLQRRSPRNEATGDESSRCNEDVTRCNEDVTRLQRAVTPSDADADADTDTDADADAEAEASRARAGEADGSNSSSNNPDSGRMFQLVERAGILVNQAMAEEYQAILEDAGDIHLVELAFQEAARTGSRPTPKWLDTVIQRCKRDGTLPGQWGPSARASPARGNGSNRIGFGGLNDSERIAMALRQNAMYGDGEDG